MSARGLTFTMRLSRSEAKRFDALAEAHGLSRSELVRFWIEEHAPALGPIEQGDDDDEA